MVGEGAKVLGTQEASHLYEADTDFYIWVFEWLLDFLT